MQINKKDRICYRYAVHISTVETNIKLILNGFGPMSKKSKSDWTYPNTMIYKGDVFITSGQVANAFSVFFKSVFVHYKPKLPASLCES